MYNRNLTVGKAKKVRPSVEEAANQHWMIISTLSCEKHWTNTHEHVHVAGRADPVWRSQAAGIVNSKVWHCLLVATV